MEDYNAKYEDVLRYCRPEYMFIVFKAIDDDCDDAFWTLELTEDDAIKRITSETEAYGDVAEFQFYYMALERNKFGTEPTGKKHKLVK